VRAVESESKQGYSPFEGQELTGRVKSTFLRGTLVYHEGQVIGSARGQYMRRPLKRGRTLRVGNAGGQLV